LVKNTGKVIIRFRFSKLKDLKYISHLDFVNLFIRALRRAEIPIAYSIGYHSKPKLSFAFALKVGWESVGEYGDIILDKYFLPEIFIKEMNNQLPKELRILNVKSGSFSKSLSSQINYAKYHLKLSFYPEFKKEQEIDSLKKLLEGKIKNLNNQYFKEVKYFSDRLVDFKIRNIHNNMLIFSFLTPIGSGDDLNLDSFINFLHLIKNEQKFILNRVLRVNMFRKEGNFLINPFSLLK